MLLLKKLLDLCFPVAISFFKKQFNRNGIHFAVYSSVDEK
jgi:hypothetical protein